MARQNPADDSCVGVLFRLTITIAIIAAASYLTVWVS
jgi:hypothetical protein